MTKENRYPVGSYCDDPTWCPSNRRSDDPQAYFVTQVDAALHVQWRFMNPNDSEWCVNAPAIDSNQVIHFNSEDGFAYALDRNGTLLSHIELSGPIGEAYTPLALDSAGRVYAQNGGRLYVIGLPPRHRAVR